MSAVMEIRAREKDAFMKKHDVKLGFMSFFVKACCAALKELSDVNAFVTVYPMQILPISRVYLK